MKIEIIPVIEIMTSNQEIPLPQTGGPSWKYPEEWENCNRLSNTKAGYSDQLTAYTKGASFYTIDDISDHDLWKAILKEIDRQQTEENMGIDDLVCPFGGGYILRIDDQDIYFPQCCGDLADISEWERLIDGEAAFFFAGHPSPWVTATANTIELDFINPQSGESFSPPIPYDSIELDKSALQIAIDQAKASLEVFAGRLKTINESKQLNIPDIDIRLIMGKDDD